MAKIRTIRPVESISGKLKKKDQVGFALRKASKNNFTVTRDDWSMKYTDPAKAQAARIRGAKFKSVSQSVSERLQNPTYRTLDEQGFRNQAHYTTLRGDVFKKCWDAYED